jgi:hypothetical protein
MPSLSIEGFAGDGETILRLGLNYFYAGVSRVSGTYGYIYSIMDIPLFTTNIDETANKLENILASLYSPYFSKVNVYVDVSLNTNGVDYKLNVGVDATDKITDQVYSLKDTYDSRLVLNAFKNKIKSIEEMEKKYGG